MSEKQEIISSLNRLLQGEYMAVESFNIFIAHLKDERVKKVFQKVQDIHRNNIAVLAEYIQNLGGRPDENLGFYVTMADFKIGRELKPEAHPSDVIEMALEGETKGINAAEKILRGDLDDQARKIAEKILDADRKAINRLQSLL